MERVDAVVIGSGFGGSVSAARLAEAPREVVVLERGKRYPPGSFPRTPREMSHNFWDPSRGMQGMFDLWSFRGLEAVVGAGLGGGSLIYANVLLRKDPSWFITEDASIGSGYENWPVTYDDLESHYDTAEAMLRAVSYPFGREPYASTPKTLAMQQSSARLFAAGRSDLSWQLPKLAVHFGPDGAEAPGAPVEGLSLHGPDVHRRACRLCGECDIGCNDGAKNTLDFNYLTFASERGADIRSGHEVTTFEHHPEGGYIVRYRDLTDFEGTNPKRAPTGELHCKVLVVSAGALGSTYLMLRNAERLGGMPPPLGTKFCGNGDLLGFIRTAEDVLEGSRGPVITSTMRVGDASDGVPGATGRGFYLQDGGYPGFLNWPIETSIINHPIRRSIRGGGALWSLIRNRFIRRQPTSNLAALMHGLIGDGAVSSGALPVLGMGRDVPDGRMTLAGKWLDIDWNTETSEAYFARVKALMRAVARELDADLTLNPTLLAKRVVTVHPLGGCPMGTAPSLDDPAPGVVDSHGEVFGHPGLFVADGAVMPGPVGPNPSLTIAALAERFSTRMIERSM